jgi:hypothetical protein
MTPIMHSLTYVFPLRWSMLCPLLERCTQFRMPARWFIKCLSGFLSHRYPFASRRWTSSLSASRRASARVPKTSVACHERAKPSAPLRISERTRLSKRCAWPSCALASMS